MIKVFPLSKEEKVDFISYEESQKILSLLVRVTTAPEKGKANKAVIKLLAKKLQISQKDLELIKGDTSRKKLFRVSLPPETLLKTIRDEKIF